MIVAHADLGPGSPTPNTGSPGLYDELPALFAEAAVFFIQRDGVLWGSSINSFPFLRPPST